MNKLRFWAIATLVLGLFAVVTPLFGETYMAVASGLAMIFTAGMYAANAEDAIKVYGRPIFW